MTTKYIFCESVHAVPNGRWHIRPLGEAGMKTTGGIDTASLCGLVTPEKNGWDMPYPLTEFRLAVACPDCVAAYRPVQGMKSR